MKVSLSTPQTRQMYRTLQVRFLPLQIADGGLKLGVFAVTRVNVCFTVSPGKRTVSIWAKETHRHSGSGLISH